MDAIIFADRDGYELAPLNQWYCPALLPLFSRPLIQHAVEACQRAGAERVIVVTQQQSKRIKQVLERGYQWSIDIKYVQPLPEQSYSELLASLNPALSYPCIAMRGDVIDKHWLNQEVKYQNASEGTLFSMPLIAAGDTVNQLAWPRVKAALKQQQAATLAFYPLTSLQQLHQVLLLSVSVQEQAAVDSGFAAHRHLHLGVGSRVKAVSLEDGEFYIDNHSIVHPDSSLSGRCFIGKTCLVDRNVSINNSVVLDNTYVGPDLMLSEAIVCRNWLYRADLNNHTTLTDPDILSTIKPETDNGTVYQLVNMVGFVCTVIRSWIKKRQPVHRPTQHSASTTLESDVESSHAEH